MLTTPHAGSAHLTFARSGSATVLTRAFATSPAKLFATNGRGPTCWVYAATLGGGLVGGDEIRLRADVTARRPGTVDDAGIDEGVSIAAPVAAEPDGNCGRRRASCRRAGSVVCFAGADFTQTQRYELHADASLVMVDWITSGRHASGERWAFSRYESRFDIRRGPQRVFFDALVLEPQHRLRRSNGWAASTCW